MRTISLLVADDHPVVLLGICELFRRENDLRIVAACADGSEAIKAMRDLKPDVAILDMSMPDVGGLDVLAAATAEHLSTRIIFLTAAISSRDIMTAVARGAHGLLLKDTSPDNLLKCVRNVAEGKKSIPLSQFESTRDVETRSPSAQTERLLTKQEWKVAALAAVGLSNKEIGRKLAISEGTAKIHLHNVFKKLKVTNRVALANVQFDWSQTKISL